MKILRSNYHFSPRYGACPEKQSTFGDARLSRWVSADPPIATGEYFPTGDREQDANLPGWAVFNAVNLDGYQYCGMNPIVLVDPDGNAPRGYSEGERRSYKNYIKNIANSAIDGVIPNRVLPVSNHCAGTASYIADKANKSIGKEFTPIDEYSNKIKSGNHFNAIRAQSMFNPNSNIKYYKNGNSFKQDYSPIGADKNFNSVHVEVGTIAVYEAQDKSKYSGHVLTVSEVKRDK